MTTYVKSVAPCHHNEKKRCVYIVPEWNENAYYDKQTQTEWIIMVMAHNINIYMYYMLCDRVRTYICFVVGVSSLLYSSQSICCRDLTIEVNKLGVFAEFVEFFPFTAPRIRFRGIIDKEYKLKKKQFLSVSNCFRLIAMHFQIVKPRRMSTVEYFL